MNIQDKTITIGTVVAELPEAAKIFESVGIDFCCGGNRTLSDVIKEQKINEVEVYDKLQKVLDERRSGYQDKNFTAMDTGDLSTYIEDTHHSYLRTALPQTSELLNTVSRAHGKNHPELFKVYKLFGNLKTELEQHLLKEETLLFPALAQSEGEKEIILELTKEIIDEHVAAGDILSELRLITDNYSIPEDVCGTFKRSYEMLEELELDLHQHIHLENNILLKEYDLR